MRLSKDKTSLAVNSSLSLEGIPPETFEYRLGNRSALEKNDSLFIEATNALAEIWVRDYHPSASALLALGFAVWRRIYRLEILYS
jgi:hypothetical protein